MDCNLVENSCGGMRLERRNLHISKAPSRRGVSCAYVRTGERSGVDITHNGRVARSDQVGTRLVIVW